VAGFNEQAFVASTLRNRECRFSQRECLCCTDASRLSAVKWPDAFPDTVEEMMEVLDGGGIGDAMQFGRRTIEEIVG
jgi:hypothetical protein